MRGKIDKLNDLYAERARLALERTLMAFLYEHNGDRNKAARWVCSKLMKEIIHEVEFNTRALGVYERLEVHDIIRGHKRAWPEIKP